MPWRQIADFSAQAPTLLANPSNTAGGCVIGLGRVTQLDGAGKLSRGHGNS